ncbi:MAG: amidohydrolase family protein, partial [Chloroflexi bacterium]|nr:amidohydrolase family protein [Chloroflexota bacterium]
YSGILDRFPNLRLLILEANSGWVPFWLNRLEKYCEGRQSVFFDDHPLKHSPQEYFLRQCAVAADADEPSIKYVVDYIGDDNIVFNTDYPHPDAPATSEPLANMMEQPLSDESKRKILWDNSVKIYGERLIAGHPLAKN